MAGQGELSERFKELVLKTSDSERNLGFESLTLRQIKSITQRVVLFVIRDSNHLNATVRRTVDCRRLDDGNSFIFAISKNANESLTLRQIHNNRFASCIFSPSFHKSTPISFIIPETWAYWNFFDRLRSCITVLSDAAPVFYSAIIYWEMAFFHNP